MTHDPRRTPRFAAPVTERLMDAAMVLASAPLEMDHEAGNALARDCEDAAGEIERLRAENERLRSKLHTLKVVAESYANAPCFSVLLGEEQGGCTCSACGHRAALYIAREALKGPR